MGLYNLGREESTLGRTSLVLTLDVIVPARVRGTKMIRKITMIKKTASAGMAAVDCLYQAYELTMLKTVRRLIGKSPQENIKLIAQCLPPRYL